MEEFNIETNPCEEIPLSYEYAYNISYSRYVAELEFVDYLNSEFFEDMNTACWKDEYEKINWQKEGF